MHTKPAASDELVSADLVPYAKPAAMAHGSPQTSREPAIVRPSAEHDHTRLDVSPGVASLLNNRWAVIAILAVAGPIGLPALWFSGRFSRTGKVITTVLFFAVTVALPLAITYYFCEIALRPLVEAFSAAGV